MNGCGAVEGSVVETPERGLGCGGGGGGGVQNSNNSYLK